MMNNNQAEVLVCEDSIMNQEVILRRLDKYGIKTTIAENGKEGIEKVEYRIRNGVKPFDLIFMDIYMPVMGGLEAADRIGELNAGTPIIAMTANNTPAEIENYTAHGMTDFLNKPFTSGELLNCLNKYIQIDQPAKSATPEQENIDIRHEEEKIKNKLIHVFVNKYKNFYNEFTKAIKDGDIKLAHRMAHTLKSSAAIFGKTALQETAKNAEELLKNEEKIAQSLIDDLKNKLDMVLNEFYLIPEPEQTNEEKEKRALPVSELFEELETMFDGGDIKCLKLTGNLRAISEIDKPLVNQLIQQMEYFEFDTAKETLAKLRKKAGENAA